MFHPELVRFFAPKTHLGWGVRVSMFLAVGLGLGLLPDVIVDGRVDQPILWLLGHVALPVLPFAIVTLLVLIRLEKAQQRLGVVSHTDQLTALSNRDVFVSRMTRALPQTGMLLMMDIDHFRSVNETRGRDIGDLCLMALAQRLRELTRHTDIIGRMDGATFAAYLPGAPVERGQDIGDRLSHGVQVMTRAGVLRATLSVGAVVADGSSSADRLMREAEAALDRAKLQGRARVILTDLPMAA